MDEHPNASTARRACTALRKADTATIRTLFANDAELVVPGRNPTAGVYCSSDEIAAFAAKRLELAGGSYQSSIHDIVAKEGHTFVIERMTAKRLGRKITMRTVTLLHVFDGCVEGGIVFSSDPYLVDEFWS